MTETHPYEWAVEKGPLGAWRTASGTSTILMSSVLTLLQDGTGSVKHHSTLSGDTEFLLLWRFLQPGELQLYQAHEDHPTPDSEEDWDVFRYKTDWRTFDVGAGPVLVNDGVEDGWLTKDGFWTLDSPVQLVGRVNETVF